LEVDEGFFGFCAFPRLLAARPLDADFMLGVLHLYTERSLSFGLWTALDFLLPFEFVSLLAEYFLFCAPYQASEQSITAPILFFFHVVEFLCDIDPFPCSQHELAVIP
jgi:hypothetical protein